MRLTLELCWKVLVKHKYPLKLWSVHSVSCLPAGNMCLGPGASRPCVLLRIWSPHSIFPGLQNSPRKQPHHPSFQGVHRPLSQAILVRAARAIRMHAPRPRSRPWTGSSPRVCVKLGSVSWDVHTGRCEACGMESGVVRKGNRALSLFSDSSP